VAEREAQFLVQPDRGIGGHRVQERSLAAGHDARGDGAHQARGEALTAPPLVGADGADLGPAVGVHPLSRHGDELLVAAQAQVGAEFDRPRTERPGLGPLDEREHLRDVGRGQDHRFRVLLRSERLGDHLHALAAGHDLPAPGRGDGGPFGAGHRDEPAGSGELRGGGPVGRVRLVGKRHERRHVRVVAQHVRPSLREARVRSEQPATYGVIQRMRHPHRHRPIPSNSAVIVVYYGTRPLRCRQHPERAID
jgi:hypothetical protein